MLAGDIAAAERVELVLPETGVCSTDAITGAAGGACCGSAPAPSASLVAGAASSCCGGPAPAGIDACCTDDATAKVQGKSGCGCNGEPVTLLQVSRTR